jgi:transposase InsO family protein
MRKLTKKKILWILRWYRNGMSTHDLSLSQNVSQRRIQQLVKTYRLTGRILLKRPGRKRIALPLEDIRLILSEHPRNSGAVILERRIEAKHHKHIPHNRIHMVLKHASYAQDDPRKQKRRKWVRYEREHSLSLVHTDWHESRAVRGKQVIAYMDDASRFVLAMDEHDQATTDNSLKTLHKAVQVAQPYGGIRQLLSDNGSQFQNEFNKNLSNIEHVYTRVHHPQTNGKMERFFRTYEEKRGRFASLDAFVTWYNTDRLHMSLKMHYAETPSEAFRRKMDPGAFLGIVKEWFE